MSQTRQLAAIMFADIVGYTALMERDEAQATSAREKLKKSLEREVMLHGGKIIKLSGDGALCSFNSATEAVRAALFVQLCMLEEPKVPLRIGIHQADVLFQEMDVHGDGVNIASRLESLAFPGSIFISAKVHDDIKNQIDIQTLSLGKYVLKNIKEPVEIYAISNAGLVVPLNKKLEGKGIKYTKPKAKNRLLLFAKLAIPILTLGALGYYFIPPYLKKQQAKNVLLPQIQQLVNDNFRPPTQAFDLAIEAEKHLPNDSALLKLWPVLATTIAIKTEPEGVQVFWKDYDQPKQAWRLAGNTPIDSIRLPRGYLRMEFKKKGYQTIEYAGPWAYGRIGREIKHVKLAATGSLPENMIYIPADTTAMYIVGLEQHGGKAVEAFLLDKFEVTNTQFKTFMNAGGYSNKTFWKYPIIVNGKEQSLESASALFTDHTGRQGPANWEAGMYPDGQENHPVTGVSWFEAAAYAAYIKKELPTVFHWGIVAATSRSEFILPFSNFSGKSTSAIGSLPNYCSFGIYDIAGNAREWCYNESSNAGQRFILGGGWNDSKYSFNDAFTQSALDRSIANGFRCIKLLPGDTTSSSLKSVVSLAFRDYHKEKPVDDKTFEIFLNHFAYDKTPLNSKIEATIEGEFWTTEKITFNAGYNNERMQAYIYLPKNFKPPYQAVLFFPGSGDIFSRKYLPESINDRIDFILKSGRVLIRPIYKGTHERSDELKSDLPDETVFYKDHVIMWRKDIGRTLDYLETRSDIQNDKIGYLGWSWGGHLGGIYPAIEKRIKVIVLNVGGMVMTRALPEVDQINFLPHITQPVLMLNGKLDMFFPLETSQKPMFEFLGTPNEHKKMIFYESGHLVPRTDFVRESLFWYDKYLGPVK